MWDACKNKRNEPQPRDRRKTNKDHACRLKARIERLSQNSTTFLDLYNNVSRGIWTNNVSPRDGEPRPLAEARHQIRPLAEAKHQATEQGTRLAPKLRETWIQNITRHLNRFHGFTSSWSLLNLRTNGAACAATSKRLAVTTKQPNAYDWAESPK